MNRHSFDISRIHRLALVLCGLALCMMALPLLQPLPTGKPTADEVAYPIRDYPLDDPHTVRDYDGVVGRLEPTGIEFVRPRCRGERGERFLFAWLPSFTDGVVVTGYRANDPAAALAVTGFVLKNSGPAAYYRIRDTRHSELPAWDWSAVANGFRRSLSPQRGATNNWGGADGAGWYVEWCDHGRYAYQSRWSPEGNVEETELVRLGERLARIGKVDHVFHRALYFDLTE